MRLDTPLAKALGAKNGKALEAKLGLVTTGDLLRHYPRRYAERGKMTPLKELAVGEHVTVWARVLRSGFRKTQSGKWLTEVVVTDGTGTLTLAFFAKNQSMATWRAEQTREGQEGLFAGTVNTFRDTLQLLHPEVFLGEDDGRFAEGLVPVYPAAASLASWNIAKAVHTVLGTAELGADPLPPEVRDRHQLLPLPDALRQIHRPASYAEVERAQQRLRWDEAFVLQVTLAQRRAQLQAQGGTPRPGRAGGLLEAFDAVLPFTLTAGQAEVWAV
ncbi:MAG: ATP-dependent helicase RecG, partial [Frankiales bacterium]|nr:ATP-dependent helicase RecG [Frankiales bacterium]